MILDQVPSAIDQTGQLEIRLETYDQNVGPDIGFSNAIEIVVLKAGAANCTIGGRTEQIAQGGMIAYWAGWCPSLTASKTDTQILRLSVPFVTFASWTLPARLSKLLFAGLAINAERSVEAFAGFETCATWEKDLRSGDPDLHKAVLLAVEGAFYRLASFSAVPSEGDLGASTTFPVSVKQFERVGKITQFVALNFRKKISVAEVARVADLEPNSASRAFKNTCGITLIRFITQIRISHARHLLAKSKLSVSDVSHAAGYRSVSRFYASHKNLFGTSPTAFRASARGLHKGRKKGGS